jgi:glutamate 5-kinase
VKRGEPRTTNRDLGRIDRLVVKVGTRLLSTSRHLLDTASLEKIARDVSAGRAGGRGVVLVTSGAVGAGMGVLGLATRPGAIVDRQACAAVGQSMLMHEYQKAFAAHDIATAQVLLTRYDISDRRRHQNIRRVMNRLLEQGILPIVNENDVVADDELKFGDNDSLSGLVADLVEADALVILTDVEGLYESPESRRRIPVVTSVRPELYEIAGGAGSAASVGGMVTKLRTAERMARAGRITIIASGRAENVIGRLLDGEDLGTLFLPGGRRIEARKRWIADQLQARGRILVDAGAAEALRRRGGSLLASGVKGVEGNFAAGSPVAVVDEAGAAIGQGLSAYGAREITLIQGKRSDRIKAILGLFRGEEIIHRNDLVVF